MTMQPLKLGAGAGMQGRRCRIRAGNATGHDGADPEHARRTDAIAASAGGGAPPMTAAQAAPRAKPADERTGRG